MRYSQSIVAKQYAKAYVAEFGSVLTLDDMTSIKSAIRFFRLHNNFMSLVNILVVDQSSTQNIIPDLLNHFKLHLSFKKLINVLIKHKRLLFFPQVLQDICCLYFVKNNILEVTIFTADVLEQEELRQFELFFAKLSEKKIISTLVLDKSLIAGICMQSDLFLWEYSIANRLKKLHQNMLN